MHVTSVQSFDYGDVVHQFEKRCNAKAQLQIKTFVEPAALDMILFFKLIFHYPTVK
ncbi:MAG: hypothetical protein MGU50_19900 [Trichodesmium sp. MAG_R02]|nr:hypothetical protein [Trichodesmium sp. MAG_R02]MDE5123166.1 hypothetical protein [Trichodesmium sp. St19_bin1]